MQADKHEEKVPDRAGAQSGSGNGILLALIAFSGFPVGDAIIKSMAGDWPAPAVAALRFSMGAIALAAILFWKEGRAGFEVSRPMLHAARGLSLAAVTLSFFSAIYIMPLADAVVLAACNLADEKTRAAETAESLRSQIKAYSDEIARLRTELSAMRREAAARALEQD